MDFIAPGIAFEICHFLETHILLFYADSARWYKPDLRLYLYNRVGHRSDRRKSRGCPRTRQLRLQLNSWNNNHPNRGGLVFIAAALNYYHVDEEYHWVGIFLLLWDVIESRATVTVATIVIGGSSSSSSSRGLEERQRRRRRTDRQSDDEYTAYYYWIRFSNPHVIIFVHTRR